MESSSSNDSEIGQISFEGGESFNANSYSVGEIFTGAELLNHWENKSTYLENGDSILDEFSVKITKFDTTFGFPGSEIYELVNYSGEGFKQPDNGYLQYIDNGELIFWEDSPTDTDYPSWYQANPERQDFSNQHELLDDNDGEESTHIETASKASPIWTDQNLFRTVDFRFTPSAESNYVTTHSEFMPNEGSPGILAKLEFTLERPRNIYTEFDPSAEEVVNEDHRYLQSLGELTTSGFNDGNAKIVIDGHGAKHETLHVIIEEHDPDGYSDELGTISWQAYEYGDWLTVHNGPEYEVTEKVDGRPIRAYFQYRDGEGFNEEVVSNEIQYGVDNGDAQISIAGRLIENEELHIVIDDDDPDGYREVEATIKWESRLFDSDGEWNVIGNDHNLVVNPLWQGNAIRASVNYVDGDGVSEFVTTEPIYYRSTTNDIPQSSDQDNNNNLGYEATNGRNDGDAVYQISGSAEVGGVLELISILSDPDGDPTAHSEHVDWFSSHEGIDWESSGEGPQLNITPELANKYIRADVSYVDGEDFVETVHTSAIRYHVDSYQENVDLVLYEPSAFAYGVGEAIGIRDTSADVSGDLSVYSPVKGGVATATAGVTESSVALSEGVAYGGILGSVDRQDNFQAAANMSVVSTIETDINSYSEAKSDLVHTMFDADAHSRLGIKDPPIELGFEDLSSAQAGGFGSALMQYVSGGELNLEATTDFGLSSTSDTKLGRGRAVTEAGNVAGLLNNEVYSGDDLDLVGIVGTDFQTHSTSDHGYSFAQSSLENSAGIQQHHGLEKVLNSIRHNEYYKPGQPLSDDILGFLDHFIDENSEFSGQNISTFLGELDSRIAYLLNSIKDDSGLSGDFVYEDNSTVSDVLRDQINTLWNVFSGDSAFTNNNDLSSFALSDGQADSLNNIANSSINPGQSWHGKDIYESGAGISVRAGTDLNAHTSSNIIGDGEADIFESGHQILYDDYSIAQTYLGESAGIISDQLGGLIIKSAEKIDIDISNNVDIDTESGAVLGNSLAESDIYSSTGAHNVVFDSGSNGDVNSKSITDIKSYSETIVGSSLSSITAEDTKGVGSVVFLFPGQDADINSEAKTTLHGRSISTHGTSSSQLLMSAMGMDGTNNNEDFKGVVEGASEVNAIANSQGFAESAAVKGDQSGLGNFSHSSAQQKLFGIKDYYFDSQDSLELTSSVNAESGSLSVMGTTTI